MREAGFEPAHPEIVGLKSTALDRSAIRAQHYFYRFLLFLLERRSPSNHIPTNLFKLFLWRVNSAFAFGVAVTADHTSVAIPIPLFLSHLQPNTIIVIYFGCCGVRVHHPRRPCPRPRPRPCIHRPRPCIHLVFKQLCATNRASGSCIPPFQ